MRLAAFTAVLSCAALSFGQTSLQIRTSSGTAVHLSAESISRVGEDARSRANQERLENLRRESSALASVIDALEAQKKALESALTPTTSTSIIQLKGNVQIKTDAMVLMADEVDYGETTGEIQARGIVRIKLL